VSTTDDFKPWTAVILDEDGYAIADDVLREWVKIKSVDLDAFWDGQEPNELTIVRGTAVPVQECPDEPARQPSIHQGWDVLFEDVTDLFSFAPEDVLAMWERAQAVAKAINEAGVR